MDETTMEEFIRAYLVIDTDSPTGLRWLGHPSKTHATRFTGKPAGSPDSHGYYKTRVQRKNLPNHRIVWFLHHGHWPTGCIDHLDGNPANNSPDNLRDVNRAENCHNIVARGCTWDKAKQKWKARIMVAGKQHTIGLFATGEDARAAYLNAKRQLHPTAPARCYS